ncbi:hypothetical protein S7335_5540 [Synechococcus sp. PCC 7335]|nr:hypothetical protein S7335_5540 [Synechococcus sp. PCC 7335]
MSNRLQENVTKSVFRHHFCYERTFPLIDETMKGKWLN